MFPGWTSNVFGERMLDRVKWLSLRTYCEQKIHTVMYDSILMKEAQAQEQLLQHRLRNPQRVPPRERRISAELYFHGARARTHDGKHETQMAAVGTLVLETMYQFHDIPRAWLMAMGSQMLKDPKFAVRFGCPRYADLDRDILTFPEH